MKIIKAVSHNGWARALSLLLTLALLFGTLLPAGTAFAADTDGERHYGGRRFL